MSSTVFERYIESKILQQKQKNFQQCIIDANLKDSELIKKIENKIVSNPLIELTPGEMVKFISNFENLPIDERKLVSYIVCDLGKDPTKQNIYEKEALSWLNRHPEIYDVKKPHNPELVLSEGIITERVGKKKVETSKSVDVTFRIGTTKFIGTIKYTKNSGGAQDNQFRDVSNFLNHAKGIEGYVAVALVDGAYYTNQKIKILQDINPDAIVTKLSDIDSLINRFK